MPSIQDFQKAFFDPAAVTDPAERAYRAKLSRHGAFVRRRARSSIRKRKRSARPGEPPTDRKGLLKKFILFGYEPDIRTVVIGPAKLMGKANYTVPEVLEHGGRVVVLRPGRKPRPANYRGNEFMGPAQAAELPKFLGSLKDSIHKGA